MFNIKVLKLLKGNSQGGSEAVFGLPLNTYLFYFKAFNTCWIKKSASLLEIPFALLHIMYLSHLSNCQTEIAVCPRTPIVILIRTTVISVRICKIVFHVSQKCYSLSECHFETYVLVLAPNKRQQTRIWCIVIGIQVYLQSGKKRP
jgi:hypothetical protein